MRMFKENLGSLIPEVSRGYARVPYIDEGGPERRDSLSPNADRTH